MPAVTWQNECIAASCSKSWMWWRSQRSVAHYVAGVHGQGSGGLFQSSVLLCFGHGLWGGLLHQGITNSHQFIPDYDYYDWIWRLCQLALDNRPEYCLPCICSNLASVGRAPNELISQLNAFCRVQLHRCLSDVCKYPSFTCLSPKTNST